MKIFDDNAQDAAPTTPPHVLDVLEDFLRQYARPLPEPMPANPRQAAQWWLAHQKPADERHEAPRTGKSGTWICPYHDRVLYTLRRFLSLSPADQRIILAAHEDGISWRGDEMDRFMDIIHEHGEMQRLGVQAYRAEALRKMRGLRMGNAA